MKDIIKKDINNTFIKRIDNYVKKTFNTKKGE